MRTSCRSMGEAVYHGLERPSTGDPDRDYPLYVLRLACFFTACFIAAFALLAPNRANAQARNGDEDARYHFRLGQVAYDTGRFAEASEQFDRAYALSQRPALLYNIFLARRENGDLELAVTALRRYLE